MTSETALLRRQEGVLAIWQLSAAGRSRHAAAHLVREMRQIHDGVYLHGFAPMTDRQRWWAAVLTAPERFLCLHSAGAAFGFRPWRAAYETVVAAGDGGPKRRNGILLHRSLTLRGHVGELRGLPITSPARTLVDLAPSLDDERLARAVREALRTGCVTCPQIQAALHALNGRKRPRRLAALAARYADLQINRTRSDPEAYALALLDAAGVEPPIVNVRVAGKEADLVWPRHRLVIELDGGSFHQFPDVDAAKTERWERLGGMEVRRFPSAEIYARPDDFLALAPAPVRSSARRVPHSANGGSKEGG